MVIVPSPKPREATVICLRNETYASLEKMLHKAIFAIQQLKKKGDANTSSAPKHHNLKRDLKTNLIEEGGNDVPQSMDQYMEPALHGDQDVLNNSTEVHPSNRTDQTDRAVYRIDPRTSEMELRLEPCPGNRADRNRARLS
ncbi:hypothetical protein F2Q69_00012154 [Brassica cretica]|uniref:Uncharacterized protein n=1 Tax=Brassica cretica TaxID=69181 RepID=A0A8S9R7Z9_BRACR|nr:hypothetical protein F2Q69_00012154 [Brassica cretica]